MLMFKLRIKFITIIQMQNKKGINNMDKFELLKERIDKFNKDRDWDKFHTPVNLAK